jgi:intracellular sulfur oxidation DsrE/DsrF family protein
VLNALENHAGKERRVDYTSLKRKCDMSVSEKPLHIDIPVRLTEVKSVYSIGTLEFEGDLPASIFHLRLIEDDIADWKAKADVIAVFHTNAGHVTLNDAAYNTERNITTGNPYMEMVADLMKRGVKIELCGATAKSHGWGNGDLLPGVDVNTDAMARTTQLVQEGFVKITE